VQLETIVHDNSLPAVIELSDFADLILQWRAHGCHDQACCAILASPAGAE
jgi:hypothetical protein